MISRPDLEEVLPDIRKRGPTPCRGGNEKARAAARALIGDRLTSRRRL